ncbi:MAG: SGNH/GDSL hydrolase family protein [Verrucomicrobiales bacterium]
MKRFLGIFGLLCCLLAAREPVGLPPELGDYKLDPAPEVRGGLLLEKGDLLAICGDSITEQKQYSVLVETYLRVAYPELELDVRQYGWSGERAEGFVRRQENDVLRFEPDVATTCYGMNDFRYVPFDEKIAESYRVAQTQCVRAFKEAGAEVVLASSGIIDSVPHWVKSAQGTKKDLNLALSQFRNVALGVAVAEGVRFADVYRPMLVADWVAKKKYGEGFKVSGKDGVHPGWAGQTIMAYAILKGLGCDGEMGAVVYDVQSGQARGEKGHEVLEAKEGRIRVRSGRMPCAPWVGDATKDGSISAGRALVPFDEELNRFVLRVEGGEAARYEVSWGDQKRVFTGEALAEGVNLMAAFERNPFTGPFQQVWEKVLAKQAFETDQIKKQVHGEAGKKDMEGTFARTEKVREGLVREIGEKLRPVEHVLVVRAVE